jgi:hypothetical protein
MPSLKMWAARATASRQNRGDVTDIPRPGSSGALKESAEVPIAISTVHNSGDEAGASGTGLAPVNAGKITQVKVFSATKARDREFLGDAVTAWLAANPDIRVLKTVVSLSSDSAFHCLSIVMFCTRV